MSGNYIPGVKKKTCNFFYSSQPWHIFPSIFITVMLPNFIDRDVIFTNKLLIVKDT